MDEFTKVKEHAENHFRRPMQLWYDAFDTLSKAPPIWLTRDMLCDYKTGKYTWGPGHALGTRNIIMLTGLVDNVLSNTTHPGNDYFDAVSGGRAVCSILRGPVLLWMFFLTTPTTALW